MQTKYGDYQHQSRKTWGKIVIDHPVIYPTLGMLNEAGEFAGKLKKVFRDQGGHITENERKRLVSELGDVLWYFTQICTELNVTLEEVAEQNLEKITSRLKRGKIHGEGDER